MSAIGAVLIIGVYTFEQRHPSKWLKRAAIGLGCSIALRHDVCFVPSTNRRIATDPLWSGRTAPRMPRRRRLFGAPRRRRSTVTRALFGPRRRTKSVTKQLFKLFTPPKPRRRSTATRTPTTAYRSTYGRVPTTVPLMQANPPHVPTQKYKPRPWDWVVIALCGVFLFMCGMSALSGLSQAFTSAASSGNNNNMPLTYATAQPTDTPEPTDTPIPTNTPIPTATPIPLVCTDAGCNPWGYSFEPGNLIYNPPSDFCGYFACIKSFWNGSGYVVECQDKMYSLSGGNSGACSYHGGEWRPLYSH